MLLQAFTKSDVASDADPRVAPLAVTDARVASLLAYCDPQQKIATASVVVRARVMTVAPALVAAGTVDLTPYIWDEQAGLWILMGAALTAVPVDRLRGFRLPAGHGPHKVFIQITNVVGAAAHHVDYAVGAASDFTG